MQPVHLRDLQVDPAFHPRGQPHLSAASGLVLAGRWLYVVADDEHHLAVLQEDDSGPAHLYRMLPGDLPADKGERKRLKPDIEALALMPPAELQPHGALLAMGSGSRAHRERGVLVALDSGGRIDGDPRVIDLSELYGPLRSEFADLNIEGAFVADGRFRLLQRANKGDRCNACIDYALDDFQAWIVGGRVSPPAAIGVTPFQLGEVACVPLGFTDGTALPGGGWMFSAVAEDTSDSYVDGACAGSAIGWVGADGRIERIEQLTGAPKVEGIALAGPLRLLMVTDPDDPAVASALLSLAL